MIRVFIGYDPREEVAFRVLAESIWRRASVPVLICPLALRQIPFFQRMRDEKQSTDFSFSRFLVPYLCDYRGMAVFMDCDMLCLDDFGKLLDLWDASKAVMVVKHDHVPRETTKFLGAIQTIYDRKNWSSFMVFNCGLCHSLTLDYVQRASGLDLHQFKWVSDHLIGELPARWNHLVGYDAPKSASVVHYTTGGPWFPEYAQCEYSREWFREHNNKDDNSLTPRVDYERGAGL